MEKCYDPRDATLTFVDGDDDLDFLYCNYKSLRAKMSCGHAVTPMSLTNYCLWLLDKGEKRFVCGQIHCEVEWPYSEVCKIALLTPEEKQHFENKLFSNATNDMDIKLCPGCKARIKRADPTNLCVACRVCTANRGRSFQFCWQCLKEWRGPAPRSDRCNNAGCTNQQLETLKNCPDIVFKQVRGVKGCPLVRACPTCGLLVEHNKTGCKNLACPRCRKMFCFVCLKSREDCVRMNPSSYHSLCSSGVAPRQTSIPVWRK